MSRIVSVWLPRWPILRFLASASAQLPARQAGRSRAAVRPCRRRRRRAAHRRPQRGGGGGKGSRSANGGRRARPKTRSDCRCAPSDAAADDAALRRLSLVGDALHADRLALVPGFWDERTAPTASSSTSPARRICSAARTSCSPTLPQRLEPFRPAGAACRRRYAGRGLGARRTFIRAPSIILPSGDGSRGAGDAADRSLAACAGDPHDAAPARLQDASARSSTSRARHLPRVLRRELLRRLDQALGRIDEPLVPIVAPPVYHSLRYLLEPIDHAGGRGRAWRTG